MKRVPPALPPPRFDVATPAGLLLGLSLLGLAILDGGSAGAFLDARALLIVLGGTAAVTAVSFSWADLRRTGSVLLRDPGAGDPHAIARQLLWLAGEGRSKGVIALESRLARLAAFPFLARGLRLAVDGLPAAQVERLMRRESAATAERYTRGAAVLYRASDVAPAMGLIGTLVGLVQMLGQLDDPASIGPAMAVALLTTFYGAVLSNMVLAPLAARLERHAAAGHLADEVCVLGVAAICRRDNPGRLEMDLNAVLPPAARSHDRA